MSAPAIPAIWFPAVRTGTGTDVFTERLVAGLIARGIRAEITGLELGANWQIAKQWSWTNNATILMTAKDAVSDLRLNYRPRFSANSAIHWTGNDGWAARVGMRHVGNHKASATIGLPSYNLWNASVSKRLNKTYQVSLGLDNIGNVKLAEKSNDFKTAERGRAVYVSLQADF